MTFGSYCELCNCCSFKRPNISQGNEEISHQISCECCKFMVRCISSCDYHVTVMWYCIVCVDLQKDVRTTPLALGRREVWKQLSF